jgi:hypothetical protein
MNFHRSHFIGLGIGLATVAVSISIGVLQSHEARCKSYETDIFSNRIAFVREAAEANRLLDLSSALSTAEYMPRISELMVSVESRHAKTEDLMPVYRKVCGEKRFEEWKGAHRNQLGL